MPLSDKAARSKDRCALTPALQHRHFAFIAKCIRGIPTPAARAEAAAEFANKLRNANPDFDPVRFLDACDCHADSMSLQALDRAVAHATYWLEHLQRERRSRCIEEHSMEMVDAEA